VFVEILRFAQDDKLLRFPMSICPLLERQNLAGRSAEGFSAVGAGADAAEMVVGVDAGGVPVCKGDLNGVVPDLRGGFGTRLGFKHRKSRRRGHPQCQRLEGIFLFAFVVARRAGALVAQIREFVVARVPVRPGNVHAGAARNMNLDAGRFFPRIEGCGHALGSYSVLRLAIAAIAWRNGIAVRAGFWVAEERADALVQFRADDVFELAGLCVCFGFVDGKSVFK